MLTIVIPVYNEHDSVPRLFKTLEAEVHTPFTVVMVYDSEDDTTLPVVRTMQTDVPFPIRLQKNAFGRGALNAIKTGLLSADTDAILVTMADNSDDLRDVDMMYAKICEGYHVVCGSRYVKGGKQIGGPAFKRFLSRMAGTSLHWVTGISTHDVTNSFKMYRRELIQSITLESVGGFEIGMEITVKAFKGGFRITEIPTTWTDREAGESNFKLWAWLPKYLRWYTHAIFASRTHGIASAGMVEERTAG